MSIIEKSFEDVKELVPTINLLIITANDIETFHVRQSLLPYENSDYVYKVPHNQHTYFIGTFGEYNAVHVQLDKMGSISASSSIVTTMSSISLWDPKAIVMIGVAMGIDDTKQRIGDVLVSETIISYEIQRLGSKKIVPRGSIVESGAVLLNRFKNVSGWSLNDDKGFVAKMLPGQILSGEKLIDNKRERDKILELFPQAIGAEMEGAGLYSACKGQNISEWLLVKGICDYGDGNKNVDKEKRQNFAAQSSTSLCLTVFRSRIGFNSIGLNPVALNQKYETEIQEIYLEKIEEEIIGIIEAPQKKNTMHTPIQITVAAFLDLNSYQKVLVMEELGLPISSLVDLTGYEMDKEFFRHVKQENLMPDLWNALNKITPFETNQNPFL